MDTWAINKGATTVDAVLAVLDPWLPHADGITISGGEPFDQFDALREILTVLRSRTSHDVLLYSGHPWEHLASRVANLRGLVDALISDPYLTDAPQTLPLRGSDNQRLHLLTDLGRVRFQGYDLEFEPGPRVLDAMFDQDGNAWLAGIPLRGDLSRLTQILSKSGHSAKTSQHRARGQAGI